MITAISTNYDNSFNSTGTLFVNALVTNPLSVLMLMITSFGAFIIWVG